MRQETPPSSPYIEHNEQDEDEDIDEDDELIYIGDADEVLNAWERGEDGSESDGEAGGSNQLDEIIEEESVPVRDDAKVTFSSHEGPVFCGSLHPTESLAVTGGEDDKAFVWSTETGNVVFVAADHKDTVTAAEFSADGNYLATGDMAGFIQVFKVTQDYKTVFDFEIGDMSWMLWHPAANVLFAGADSGETYVWRIPSGDCKVLQGNGHKAEMGSIGADGKTLVVGYTDGAVKVWDIKSSSVIQDITSDSPFGHTGAVTSIAVDPDNGRFLTGSEDGKILLANSTGPLCNMFPEAGSVEALAFCPDREFKIVACGTLLGKVSLWDVNRQAVRMECQNDEPTGITKVLWAGNHTLLCATLDGSIRAFDGRNGERKVSTRSFQPQRIETNAYFPLSVHAGGTHSRGVRHPLQEINERAAHHVRRSISEDIQTGDLKRKLILFLLMYI